MIEETIRQEKKDKRIKTKEERKRKKKKMRDLESLINQMIKCKQRYWRLFVKESGSVRSEATNFQQEDTTMEDAIEVLRSTVAYYENDPQTVFLLELTTTNKGNAGSGKTDRIPFVADYERYKGEKQKSLPQQINPLEGLQQTYNHATQIAGEIRQQENSLNQRELDFRDRMSKKEIAFMLREMEIKRKEEEIKKKEEEIKILEVEYTSHSNKVAKGVMTGLENLAYSFVEKGMPGVINPNSPPLSGLEAQPEQTPDERLKTVTGNLIESIATNAFEKMNADQAKAWGLITEAFIQNPNDPRFAEFTEKSRRLIIQQAG